MDLEKVIEKVENEGTFLSKPYLNTAMLIAIQKHSAKLAYDLACVLEKQTDRKKMEKVVLEAKNPEYSYMFARDIAGADIKKHQEVVVESNDVEQAVNYASDIPGADVKTLEQIVLASENAKCLYEFAMSVENADIKALGKELVKTKDVDYIKKFEDNVENADMNLLRLARGRITKMKKKEPNFEL